MKKWKIYPEDEPLIVISAAIALTIIILVILHALIGQVMDNVSLKRILLLHPAIRNDAREAYNEAVLATPPGVHPLITSTLRTFKQQADLYAQGRTKPGKIVTRSKPGQSYHNYGMSLDFTLQIGGNVSWEVDSNWMIVVNCFKDHGFVWGGNFTNIKDYPHFEKRLGFHWKQLLVLHDREIFIPGNTYIDLT